jgi:OOP family OmpA-OmpF porin
MTMLQRAIADARAGGEDYNLHLSIRRADVVRDAPVDLGARRKAIKTAGVGETDLAVQTGDGVRNADNRRSVITPVI